MAYTKNTLRKMTRTPETRKVAEAINDLEKGLRKIKRLLPVMQELEFHSKALKNGQHPPVGEPPTASQDLEIRPNKNKPTPDIKTGAIPPGWEDLGGN